MVKRKKKNNTGKIFLAIVFLLAIVAGWTGYKVYGYVFNAVVEKNKTIYLEDTTAFNNLKHKLADNKVIKSEFQFQWVAEIKKFDRAVLPGKYVVKKGMSHNDIINLFRSGNQTPVKLTFNNIRTRQELSGVLAKTFMNDSIEFLNLLLNESYVQKNGFDIHTALCPFIPNTYEMYWNSSPQKVYDRMLKEYKKFWTDKRKNLARQAGLSEIEVLVLASIVEEETKLKKEKPIVAGLYINRLNRGIALQADPTLRFALNDFGIKRVLNEHKKIESPYNTYKYKGLPPGPIRVAEISSIDAVLNYSKHKYLYMCAKADFSGEHAFAKTLSEHNRNARAYHRALNKKKIYK